MLKVSSFLLLVNTSGVTLFQVSSDGMANGTVASPKQACGPKGGLLTSEKVYWQNDYSSESRVTILEILEIEKQIPFEAEISKMFASVSAQ